jgi:hypothetical protein
MLPRVRSYEKLQFQYSITPLLLVLEQKMFSNLTIEVPRFQGQTFCWFYTKNVCKSVPVVAIKFILLSVIDVTYAVEPQ